MVAPEWQSLWRGLRAGLTSPFATEALGYDRAAIVSVGSGIRTPVGFRFTDTTNTGVRLSPTARFDFVGNLTIAVYARLDGSANQNYTLCGRRNDAATELPYQFRLNPQSAAAGVEGIWWDGVGYRFVRAANTTFAVGAPTLFVYTRHRPLNRLYVDSRMVAEQSLDFAPLGAPARPTGIGAYFTGDSTTGEEFHGDVYLAALWDRALSGSEVRQLAADPFGPFRYYRPQRRYKAAGGAPAAAYVPSLALLGVGW